MELSGFLNSHQSSKRQRVNATDLESIDSLVSLSQSTVSNVNKMFRQVLFPSEDTIKSYLYLDQHKNTDENIDCERFADPSNTAKLDVDRLYLKSRFRSELDYLKTYDMTSASVYSDTINQLFINLVYHNNLSLEALNLNEYGNLVLYQHYDDYRASQGDQLFTHNDYIKLRANTLLLARIGYKLTLTLNTDNNKVKETWNPNVARKILAVEYSPLSLKKGNLATTGPLNKLESMLLAEALNAFQVDEPIKLPSFSKKIQTDPSPGKFIYICRKLESYRKLCKIDKILLLSNTFHELVSMNVAFKYNQATDDWTCPEYGTRFSRRDLYLWNRPFHDLSVPVIEKLPDRWRKDETVEALLGLIVIFNPDQTGLVHPDTVRDEQYAYIYLLKRYLELVCESPWDASDNLYRLLRGVEKFREMGIVSCESTNVFEPGYHRSFLKWIIDEVNTEDN